MNNIATLFLFIALRMLASVNAVPITVPINVHLPAADRWSVASYLLLSAFTNDIYARVEDVNIISTSPSLQTSQFEVEIFCQTTYGAGASTPVYKRNGNYSTQRFPLSVHYTFAPPLNWSVVIVNSAQQPLNLTATVTYCTGVGDIESCSAGTDDETKLIIGICVGVGGLVVIASVFAIYFLHKRSRMEHQTPLLSVSA